MLREIVTLDIETESILTGKGSVVPWEAKITDIGLCWGADFETETVCYGAEQVEAVIKSLSEKQTPLVPYNALFEVAMLDYHFPQYPLNWIGDCALCSIALDNSVEDFDLKSSAGRLVNYEPYHLEVMNYCVSTFNCGATKWGEHIPMLPSDMRQEYCRKDVHATYLIWQRACDELKLDVLMDCFMAEVFLTAEAYLCGTRIDREFATELMSERQGKIDSTRASFLSHPELVEHIEAVQESKFNKEVAKRLAKSKTGKTRPIDKEAWLAKNPFNPGSEQQLTGVFKSQKLFFDESTQTFRFPATTPTGAPQLDAAHIHLYGVGGQILAEAGEIETERNKLRTILEDSEYDGRAHFNVNLCTVRSTRVSSSGLNIVATPLDGNIGKTFLADDGYTFFGLDFCLHPKTEYLTKRGWVPVLELSEEDEVWQVEPVSLQGSWVKPLRIIKRLFNGKMLHYKSGQHRGNLSVTENHRMLWVGQLTADRVDKQKQRFLRHSQDYKSLNHASHFCHFSSSSTESCFSDEEIWLACAIQADGTLVVKGPSAYWVIQVSEERKREKLSELLCPLGIFPKESTRAGHKPIFTYSFSFESNLLVTCKEKLFNLDELGSNQADVFTEALKFFDGSFESAKLYETGRFQYFSTSEINIDTVQSWLVRSGYEAKKSCIYEGGGMHKKCFSLSIKEKGTTRFGMNVPNSSCKVDEELDYDGYVGCVTVDTGFILVRSEGQTFVTGNCALEPTVQAIVSGDPSLKYCVYDGEGVKPYYDQDLLKIDDVYLTVGSVSELYGEFIRKNINPDDWMADKEAVKYAFKKQRQILKIITLMTLYGSGIENVVSLVAKLAKVQITFKQGQSLVNALWSAFPGLYSFNVRLQNQARRQGHITTCMGFKIMTPDNVVHCILNYLCQTTAAHVMKMFLYQLHLRVQRDYKWARPAVVDVHDATFWMVKEERVADFRIICEESLNDMNETLKFPINFRFSASIGKTLYHGKGGH